MLDKVQDFTVGWWNTGVHPIKGDAKVEKEKVYIFLKGLLSYCDLLVLGEQIIDSAFLDFVFRNSETSTPFASWDLSQKNGNCQFKTVLLWNTARIQVDRKSQSSCFTLDSATYTDNYRVGQRLLLEIDLRLKVELYMIHWPQHSSYQGEELKIKAAEKLYRNFIQDNSYAKLIVGDFNTEPYSTAFAALNASRSSCYAQKEGTLWNPFWSLLPEVGTINSPNNKELKCLMPLFDQILISSDFLTLFDTHPKIITGYEPPKGGHCPVILQFTRKEAEHEHARL